MQSDAFELYREYCRKCGCKLIIEEGFGYSIVDKKRRRIVILKECIMQEASELNQIHKLEDKLKSEKDFKKRRLIKSHLHFIDNMPI